MSSGTVTASVATANTANDGLRAAATTPGTLWTRLPVEGPNQIGRKKADRREREEGVEPADLERRNAPEYRDDDGVQPRETVRALERHDHQQREEGPHAERRERPVAGPHSAMKRRDKPTVSARKRQRPGP